MLRHGIMYSNSIQAIKIVYVVYPLALSNIFIFN